MQFGAFTILLSILFGPVFAFYQSNYEIRDLESTDQLEFREETRAWVGQGAVGDPYDTACGSIPLFSGYGYTTSEGPWTRTYSGLQTHQSITLSFEAYVIDPSGGGQGPVFVVDANPTVLGFEYDNSVPLTSSICGTGANDLGPVTVLYTIVHAGPTLQLQIIQGYDNVGIRNIKISIQVGDVSSQMSCSIANPLTLISPYNCDCLQGQYMSGSCTGCDDGCENCYDAGASSCYACTDNYYFDGTSCLECDNSCETCYGSASNTCYSCIDGYYFDGTSSCLICDNSCETCSGPDSDECLTCPWGDPADANDECILVCDTSCATCYDTDANTCNTCNDGYYFDGTSSCPQCDNSCGTCSGPNSNECLTCPWGDPADANNECILVCNPACNTCFGPYTNMCNTCNDGFYFDGTSSCLQCHSSCDTCSGPGKSACLTCPWGAADGNNQCKCDSACKTCFNTDVNSCNTCNDGFYFDGTSSCLSCSSSCETCSGPDSNQCLTCSWGSADSNHECVAPAVKSSTKTITDVKAQTQTLVGAGLIANTMLNAGGSGAIRMSMLAQMIQYIKYLDIDYPSDLRYAISDWDDDFINFNTDALDLTPNSFEKSRSSYGPLPRPITMYDYDINSSFLMNFWDELIPIFFIFAVLVLLRVIEIIVLRKAQKELTKKIMHQLRLGVQGVLITYIYNDFSDIFFFAILSFRTTKKVTVLTIANIIASVLFMVFTIGALVGQTWLIRKYQTLKEKDHEEFAKFQAKIEGVKILWKDFKEDSFLQMNALLFTVLHSVLFCIILAAFSEYPMAQVIIANILSIAMLVYLLWCRPFDEKHELIQTIVCEAILFAVNLCLLILVTSDSKSSSRDSVGQTILVLTLVFNFVPLFFLGVTLVIVSIKIYRAVKAYRLKKRLGKLKTSVLQIKKNQISPLRIPKDDSPPLSYAMSPEISHTNSLLVIGQHSSAGTAAGTGCLLLQESPRPGLGPSLFSPSSKPTLHLVGMSDHDDQLLRIEDSMDSGKFSRATLLAKSQQNILRQRAYLNSRKNTFINIDADGDNLAE